MTVSRSTIPTPHRASELGMNFIHQELAFVPSMSVVQNIMLGLPKTSRFGLVDWRPWPATSRPWPPGSASRRRSSPT